MNYTAEIKELQEKAQGNIATKSNNKTHIVDVRHDHWDTRSSIVRTDKYDYLRLPISKSENGTQWMEHIDYRFNKLSDKAYNFAAENLKWFQAQADALTLKKIENGVHDWVLAFNEIIWASDDCPEPAMYLV